MSEYTDVVMLPVPRERRKKNGSPPAEFETDADRSFFLIRLPVQPDADLEQPEEEEAPASRTTSGETSEKTSEKILEMMRNNPEVTIQELADGLGRSTRAVEMQIRKLRAAGHVERVGPAKSGHWEVREAT